MPSPSIPRKLVAVSLAGAVLIALSACAIPYQGAPLTGLPEAATKLIRDRYSSDPALRRAAEGFAANTVNHWRVNTATGLYDDELSRKSGNSQMCWTARVERTLNRPVTAKELRKFLAALASTRELVTAHKASNRLQSGHPLILSSSEKASCRKAGIA